MFGGADRDTEPAWPGLRLGLYLGMVSTVAVVLWQLRVQTLPEYEQRRQQARVLALGAAARGSAAVEQYREGDLVRVAEFAPALERNGQWRGVPADAVLVVLGVRRVEDDGGWLMVTEDGSATAPLLMVHASFVERYEPVRLEGGLELSECVVRRHEKPDGTYFSVSGRLRNATSQTLTNCRVVCEFRGLYGQVAQQQASAPLRLAPGEFARFETGAGRAGFARLVLRVRYERDGVAEESSEVVLNPRAAVGAGHEPRAD
jgi:hypothetical protein